MIFGFYAQVQFLRKFAIFGFYAQFNVQFQRFRDFYSNSQKNRENGMKTRKSSKIRKNRENPKSLNLKKKIEHDGSTNV